MVGRGAALLAVITAACSFDPGASSNRSDAGAGDGGVDAAVDAGRPPGSHLLISEVKTGPDTLEFIEIYNPSCQDVELSSYYLSDDPAYSLLPSWTAPMPDLGEVDAIVRFPAGSLLPARGVAVIAHSGTGFADGFGSPADYALTSPGGATPMEYVARGAQNNMTVAADGEPVVLFEWDGARDLVRDIDLVIAGEAPTPSHQLVPKQVLAPGGVDGPDGDARASQYAEDQASLGPMLERDANAGSYHRILLEGPFEIDSGGNGIGGHDETSEDIETTWEQDPGTAPTPGEVPVSIQVDCVGSAG